MAEPYVPFSQGAFDPYSGQVFGAPPAGGLADNSPESYTLIDVYQTWQMITRRPEYQSKDPNGKLEVLNNFVEDTKLTYGPNPHGLASLQISQEKLIKGETSPEQSDFGDALADEQYYYDLGRADVLGRETQQEMRSRADVGYEEYVRRGGLPETGFLTGLGAAITHTIGSAVVGAGAGAAAGAPFAGIGAGPAAAVGGVAAAAGEAGIRERGRALQLRYFANLDSGMDKDEAWNNAMTGANVTGAVVGSLSAIDPTKRVAGAVARGALGKVPQQTLARGAATTGATRFALERAGQGAVVGSLGAGSELIDYTQSRYLTGNVDDSYLMGTLGQRMAIGGVAGAAIHGTAPVLGKAFKTAKVLGSKDFKGKSWATKYNAVFAEQNFAGALGHLQLLADDAKAGKRPGGAEGLDVMVRREDIGDLTPEQATQTAMDIWNTITDGTEPIKFRVVDEATGTKVVADDVDAQYNRSKQTIDAYLNMFRWDKDEGQRVTLNHEASHAFMDTLPIEVVKGLRKLWLAESEYKAGPLYREVSPEGEAASGGPQLRKNIHPEVETSFREWFAEHMAIANDAWAKGKIDAAANKQATPVGVFGRLSEIFRGKSEKVGRLLGLRPEGLYSAFRDFMDAGEAYTFGRVDKSEGPWVAAQVKYISGVKAQIKEFEGTFTGSKEDLSPVTTKQQLELWHQYPNEADLENATQWVKIAGIEGRKQPAPEAPWTFSNLPKTPTKLSKAEIAKAQARVLEIDEMLSAKGVSRKQRTTLKAEKREIQKRVSEQLVEVETKPRTFTEERKAEGRDAVEFAEDRQKYADKYEAGGSERKRIAEEARKAMLKSEVAKPAKPKVVQPVPVEEPKVKPKPAKKKAAKPKAPKEKAATSKTSGKRKSQRALRWAGMAPDQILREAEGMKPWELTHDEYWALRNAEMLMDTTPTLKRDQPKPGRSVDEDHKNLVAQALEEGKPVPRKILEYHGLESKPPKEKPVAQTPDDPAVQKAMECQMALLLI